MVMDNFQELGLSEMLLRSLQTMQISKPTPIQAQTIPPALQGRDVLGSAQTGTGKTYAYGIPLIEYLRKGAGSALVLAPTRELALQVLDSLKKLLGNSAALKTVLLIGGESMFKQLNQLKLKPKLIVGTPGRVNDHLLRGSLKLGDAGFLVLDETDRMLDMGFSIQLQEIAKFLPKKRQTLMFSATMPDNIVKIAESYLRDAIRVSVGATTLPIEKIQQEVVRTSEAEKFSMLLNLLNNATGSVILFAKTKSSVDKLAKTLRDKAYRADAIHGDLRQRTRERVIKAFRERKINILVATDIAARGLDISHVECVVNYDLPQCPEDYIHRIGRTGRAGAEGKAVSLLTPQDNIKWKNICKLMNGEKTDPQPYGTRSQKRNNNNYGKRNKFSRNRGNGGSSRPQRSGKFAA